MHFLICNVFSPAVGLSHHYASTGDGDKWVIVSDWSYGGTIYSTSKKLFLLQLVVQW